MNVHDEPQKDENTVNTAEAPEGVEAPEKFSDLSPDEQRLLHYWREERYSAAYAMLGKLINKPTWSYEHRVAFAVLGRLGLAGALTDETLNSPHAGYLERLIDSLAETISESLYALGGYSSLQEALNDASPAPEKGGAE